MIRERLDITNPSGLDLAPAGLLCHTATRFLSRIEICCAEGNTINAKSILSVLGACAKCGDDIELICEGPDEEEAFLAISDLIKNGLGEK
ncbi:HPr family phosphocarrier protein [Parasporobacterium paucivorans]|uniref:Phosphocarrier protein n=1 Tax=Parasporobacterium paucivorans DSM 15970 TaxID=1122934 RepID=A0A1M6JSS6_9FIRM|nr:HPr family phosphocarrier protein [Parasporobacterium paucivorans]SHJ49777.1 phosphocarrier protein [Parasporobacterium paucivorans DSM 15970]